MSFANTCLPVFTDKRLANCVALIECPPIAKKLSTALILFNPNILQKASCTKTSIFPLGETYSPLITRLDSSKVNLLLSNFPLGKIGN